MGASLCLQLLEQLGRSSSVVSRHGHQFLSFAVALPGPGTGCDRQIRRPGWLARHQTGEFFDAAEADRHFAYELVVHMQHDRIAGGFNTQHRFSQQITRDAADNIFGPKAAIGALAEAAVNKFAAGVVGKQNARLAVLVFDDSRPRVAEFSA